MSADLLGTLAEWQAAYGDVVHLHLWPEHQIVLTDPLLVHELLGQHHDALVRWERGVRIFAQLEGRGLFTTEGRAWRAKRRALQPSFSAPSVRTLVPTITATVAERLAQWPQCAAQWPIESALSALAMDVILRTMFSSAIGSDARQAEQAVHDLLVAVSAELYWPASWPNWLPWKRAKQQGLKLLKSLIDRQIDARLHQAPGDRPDDLLSRLLALHSQDGVAWSRAALRNECMTTFLAGHETTAASLTWWAWCMAANPTAQALARREVQEKLGGRLPDAGDLAALTYLSQTLQESLRLYPAAPLLLTRRSTRPITLGNWQLPARTLFMVPLSLIQRDPRWFPEPETFRPERFAHGATRPRGTFMPFGDGPRICLGQHLALAEMTTIAALLLQRFTLATIEGASPPRPRFHISLRPDSPLHLQLAPAPLFQRD